jgi:hypothetical protein
VGLPGRLPRVRNSWQKNVGGTSKPVGLCSPPPPDQPGHDGHHHQEKHKKKDPCTCQRNPKAI